MFPGLLAGRRFCRLKAAFRDRFMERGNLQNLDANRDHEPEMHKSLVINGRIFTFMESLLGRATTHWDYEPQGVWNAAFTRQERGLVTPGLIFPGLLAPRRFCRLKANGT